MDDEASDPQVATTETTEVKPEVTTTETKPETTTAAEVKTETTEVKVEPEVKRPWYLDRIAEEAGKKRAAEARAEAAEREAKSAKELADRLQDPDKTKTTNTKIEPTKDFNTAVKEEADRLRFADETVIIRDAGRSEFKDFNDALRVLTAVNATNDEFIMDVMAVDKANAHKILHKLAQNPERASQLVDMTSRQRIAELTRMSMTETKPATTVTTEVKTEKVSQAPKPRPTIEAVSEETSDPLRDYEGKSTDEEFSAAWDAKYKKTA